MDNDAEKVKDLIKNGRHLLQAICCETLARDRGISEQEFKERMGMADSPLSEQEIIRQAVANILIKKTMLLVSLKTTIMNNVELLKKIKEQKENANGQE